MAIVIRRTAKPTGTGWPLRPGFPYNSNKKGWHLLIIKFEHQVLFWRPHAEMWTCGLAEFSPGVVGQHDYVGECTPVYRQPPVENRVFKRRDYR